MNPKAKWTFMIYMAVDNSLSDAGDTDLGEMRQAESSAYANVMIHSSKCSNTFSTNR